MKRSIPTLLLCFALLAGCSTQSPHQDVQPIERFTLNGIGNQQVGFDGVIISIPAFGDKLENLHFAKGALVKLNVDYAVPIGELTDVESIFRKKYLLKINYAQLN